jgi:PAS domain S-box-containing protein
MTGDPPASDTRLDEAQLRAVFHALDAAAFLVDPETGAVLDANETTREMYGYDPAEARRLGFGDLCSGDPPYTAAAALAHLRRAAAGDPHRFEWQARDSDGDRFRVEIRVRRLDCGAGVLALCDDAEAPGRGPGGDRERELRETRLELDQSNAKLERFAHVASHDLREPLRMVSSYLTLLEAELDGLDGETEEYLRFALDGADRMRAMVDGLRQYSRVQTRAEPPEVVDASVVAEATLHDLDLLVAEAEASVDVGDLPPVRADPDQLGQLFQNLLRNAVEHGGDGVDVTVSGSVRDGVAEFAVADDGHGIPADRLDAVFDIFETGGDSDGTGIGLAICRQIVQRHGGDIWAESGPGAGTTLRFTLPLPSSDT